jgi:CubicO group peptidase (beta-lactamase class C family)
LTGFPDSTESQLLQELTTILSGSSVQFADVSAGTAAGQSLHLEYTSTEIRPAGNQKRSGDMNVPASDGQLERLKRRYLIASITKPIVGMLAVQLASEGRLSLNEPVREFVDGFNRGPLRAITFRHLLTHTSGLPDMLLNNNELRARYASLAEFVSETAKVTPEFPAGTGCRYSSMGFAVLAEVIEKMTQTPLPELLRRDLFGPLGMQDSWLGIPSSEFERLQSTLVPCELPIWQQQAPDWNWNSRYWRCLGAPWGGMTSTSDDLGRLAVCMLNQGESPDHQSLINSPVVSLATQNQTCHMSGLTESDRLHRPWGLGWRFNWPDHATCFSDFVSPEAYGHWGATGTLMWIDPGTKIWCVILTNQPYEVSQTVIQRLSNRVASVICQSASQPSSN